MNVDIKADATLKDFWQDNGRFADLFSQVFFGGEEPLDPSKLSDQDTDESAVLMGKEKIASITRHRDLIKEYGEDAEFVLIGLENQMRIHYAMPVRTMVYDALRYVKQCKDLENQNRKGKVLKGSDEFLSGMTKEDRIKPVVTLVIYYGERDWDGPVSLEDMMDIPDKFKKFINNQTLHLLRVRDAKGFQFKNQDNRDFFTMIDEIYNNGGKVDLKSFKEKYPDFEIYWETLAAIGAATGTMELVEYAYGHKGGRLNMCTALDNLKQEGIQEGIQEGKMKTIQETVTLLRKLNLDDDNILWNLQETYHISEEEAKNLLAD